jgi:hypothetical protein
VAHIVADQTALTGEFADARHDVCPVQMSLCGITEPRKSLPLTLHAEKVKSMCGQKR